MPACPHCRAANPEHAEACVWCAGAMFEAAAVVVAAPLPAPMVEPVRTPTGPAPDSKPLPARPALAVADSTPAPATVCTRRPSPTSTPAPADPANESGGHHLTVPATAPADDAPTDSPPAPPPPRPKLVVLRGMKVGAEYLVYEGRNTVGRFADKPVDIDLVSQEAIEQIWCSRLHAAVVFDKGAVVIEDLNSLNGTWVNGTRIHPGQPRQIKPGDVIQVGTVQLKLTIG